MNQLEGNAVTRHFGDVVAVSGVNLRVDGGEVVGLVGANGSGKTTLIRMLLGLLAPTSGTVSLFGAPPAREARARVGYVPQLGGLYDYLTVVENLEFQHSAYAGKGRPRLPDDLADLANRICGGLSLGLRRRVAFAMALSHDPQLLVLDEPTSGVDSLARTGLWDTIRSAAERGIGVLVTTHHMSEAGQCDRLLVLSAGRVVATGTQRDIVGDTTVVEVHADPWEPGFRALDDAGLLVSLAGRDVRVIDADRAAVERVLGERGIAAVVSVKPATLDETFVRLARAQTAAPAATGPAAPDAPAAA